MTIISTSFADGGFIPEKHHYRKGNVSPELRFRDVPKEAKSLALDCIDPDAPGGHWAHWVIWDIPPSSIGFREHQPLTAVIPDVCHQGTNDYGATGWGGPCPPSGTHRYVFTLYALDIAIGPQKSLNSGSLLAAIEGHVIETAVITGKYSA